MQYDKELMFDALSNGSTFFGSPGKIDSVDSVDSAWVCDSKSSVNAILIGLF